MNKKRISKYTRKLTEAAQNTRYLQEIARLKRELAAQRKRSEHEISVLKGKLERVERKAAGLQQHIEVRNKVEQARIKVVNLKAKREAERISKKPISNKGMTTEQAKVYNQTRTKDTFIPQFMARLQAHYGDAFNDEQYMEIEAHLLSMDPHQVYIKMKGMGDNWTEVMYGSDATYSDITCQDEPKEVYEELLRVN